MVKVGLRPMRSAWRRRRRAQIEWNVPSHRPSALPPTSPSTRSRISRAALLVKVTARIWLGQARRVARIWASRVTSTRVLPVPAPASTSTAPSSVSAASRCSGLSASSHGPELGENAAMAWAEIERPPGCGAAGAGVTPEAGKEGFGAGAGVPLPPSEAPAPPLFSSPPRKRGSMLEESLSGRGFCSGAASERSNGSDMRPYSTNAPGARKRNGGHSFPSSPLIVIPAPSPPGPQGRRAESQPDEGMRGTIDPPHPASLLARSQSKRTFARRGRGCRKEKSARTPPPPQNSMIGGPLSTPRGRAAA